MKPDPGITKLFVVVFILSFAGLIAAASFLNLPSQPALTDIGQLQSEPPSYVLGDVPRLGGLLVKEFLLTNASSQTITLNRLATSCMCTQAKVISASKETKLFGMETRGDRNPPVNISIPPGESFKVVFNFDPNAHGPRGVGPVDRSLLLYFSRPRGLKELKFSGNVI